MYWKKNIDKIDSSFPLKGGNAKEVYRGKQLLKEKSTQKSIHSMIFFFFLMKASRTSLDIWNCREPAYCILSAALSTASSFRIWNSSTGILSLPGASVRNSAHDKGHEEGGSAYAKAGSSLRSPPGNSRASTPKTRVCLFSALCFHLHL